jgi:hypothetical protein
MGCIPVQRDTPPIDEPPLGTARSRLTAGVVVLLILLSTVGGLWWAFGRGERRATGETQDGYFVAFPEDAGPPAPNGDGGATLTVATNLPAETMVMASYDAGSSGSIGCCRAVSDGLLVVEIDNQHCLDAFAPQSDGFSVSVVVVPVFGSSTYGAIGRGSPDCPGGCAEQPQPSSVLAVLGERFENLTGDQVTTLEDGTAALVATSEHFDWPEDTCRPARAAQLTETCTYQEPLLVSLDRRIESVAGAFIQAINESNPCLLYGDSSPEYQDANPWLEFRDAFFAWIDGLGPLDRTEQAPGGPLSFEIVSRSEESFVTDGIELPEEMTVDYFAGEARVARVEFLHAFGEGDGAAPQYHVIGLELFPAA